MCPKPTWSIPSLNGAVLSNGYRPHAFAFTRIGQVVQMLKNVMTKCKEKQCTFKQMFFVRDAQDD
jgi:hypothetical protein